jgi:hypothetical protein
MNPRHPTRSEIRTAVRGSGGPLERRAAFALLAQSDDPEREALLASVADDPRELPQQRSAAAITLGHIPTPKAEQLLLQNLNNSPPEVLPDVLRSLGRIGSPQAIPLIEAFATADSSPVTAAARFAAALLAHRFGLAGHDLPVPAPQDLLPLPSRDTRPVEVAVASDTDTRAVLASLAHEGYGVELYGSSLTEFRCGTEVNTVCVNREFVEPGASRKLLKRKAVLALVALQSREGAGHSVSYIILSKPSSSGDEIDLLAPRCTGHPALAGYARVTGDEIRFSLRSVDRPGARAFALDGTIERGRIGTTLAVAATKRNPAPLPAYLSLT